MRSLRQDLRLALRRQGRAPGFTATVVLTPALGIALATAVPTVADSLLLRWLAVTDQDRLTVLTSQAAEGMDHVPLGLEDARALAAGTRTLAAVALAIVEGAAPVTIREGEHISRRRSFVSGDCFTVPGTEPLLGRSLGPKDEASGASPVVVLSHRTWQT